MGATEMSPISVRASDPLEGHFTHLAITSTIDGRTHHETLILTGVGSDPNFTPASPLPGSALGFTPRPNVSCGDVEIVDSASPTHRLVSVSVSLYRSAGTRTPTCATAVEVTRLWASTATPPPAYPPGFQNDISDSPPPGQQVAEWRIDGPHHSQVIIGHLPGPPKG